jgi:hypothetical protein
LDSAGTSHSDVTGPGARRASVRRRTNLEAPSIEAARLDDVEADLTVATVCGPDSGEGGAAVASGLNDRASVQSPVGPGVTSAHAPTPNLVHRLLGDSP